MTNTTLPRTYSAPAAQQPQPAEPSYLRTVRRLSVPLLRLALGLVFVWFGALEVAGVTPVGDLVAGALPWFDAAWVVPALGAFEVLLGLVLVSGKLVGLACAAMIAHLGGTFLVYVMQPEVAFTNGNPLLMTMEGEFVAKNVVLITAGLVVALWSRHARALR
ncbi:MAG: hypothetical protein GEV07_22425 [Streptosporangiales bacterium]|nr:hypothetical protein [Streptosporangiales bacterium]